MNRTLMLIALFFALSEAQEPMGEMLLLEASTDISEQALEVLAEGEGSTYFGIPWQVEASSTLEPQGGKSYEAWNLLDGSVETAWVEGEEGYGNLITVTFTAPEVPAVTFGGNTRPTWDMKSLVFFNGYQADGDTWRANARFESLMMLKNGRYVCFITLEDTMQPQEVDLTGVPDMLGPVFGDMEVAPGDRITFELIDVYPGSVWDDLALSEVYLIGR